MGKIEFGQIQDLGKNGGGAKMHILGQTQPIVWSKQILSSYGFEKNIISHVERGNDWYKRSLNQNNFMNWHTSMELFNGIIQEPVLGLNKSSFLTWVE